MAPANPSLSKILSPAGASPLTPIQEIRLRHYGVFVTIGTPIMAVFSIYHLVRGDHAISLALLLSMMGLLLGLLYLNRVRDEPYVYRGNALLFGGILLYMLYIGGAGGSKALWMYTYPLIVTFLLGTAEGAIWGGAALVCVAAMFTGFHGPAGAFPYHPEFKLRFVLTYTITTCVALWFEHLRTRYLEHARGEHLRVEEERARLAEEVVARTRAEEGREKTIAELRRALEQVNTLSGLIPICASCKSIRDDEGYWQQLEGYMNRHSGLEFSHGICPQCFKKLYPGVPMTEG